MIYKDYKIDLEIFFISSIINFRTYGFTCSIVYYHVTIHYYVFTVLSISFSLWTLLSITFYFLLTVHSSILYIEEYLFQSWCPCTCALPQRVCLNAFFFKFLFRFHTVFSRGIFNSFASCNNSDNRLVYKKFVFDFTAVNTSFYTSKYPSESSEFTVILILQCYIQCRLILINTNLIFARQPTVGWNDGRVNRLIPSDSCSIFIVR